MQAYKTSMDAIQKWTNAIFKSGRVRYFCIGCGYSIRRRATYIVVTKMADDLQSSEEVSTNSNTILLKTLYYNVTNYILVVKYDH